jgi:hypothetical protein
MNFTKTVRESGTALFSPQAAWSDVFEAAVSGICTWITEAP